MHSSLIKGLLIMGQMATLAMASFQHAQSHQNLESRQEWFQPGQYLGCYTTLPDGASTQGSYSAQSSGYCNSKCASTDAIYLTYNLEDCACASQLPPTDSLVDDSLCSGPCKGWAQNTCGSASNAQAYSVYLSVGHSIGNVPVQQAASNTSSTEAVSSSTAAATTSTTSTVAGSTTVTAPGTTFVSQTTKVIYTTPPASTSTSSSDASSGNSGSGNTVAIAVGVVVGVVGLIAIIVAALFCVRSRRRRINADNTHRRAESLNAFVASGATLPGVGVARQVSVTDSRLDPRIMVEQRRESTGSVFADNQDYSRRILKIANPDGL